MGWSFQAKDERKKFSYKSYIPTLFDSKYTVIDSRKVGSVVYAAVKRDEKVFAVVILLKVTKYEVGYKAMTEDMGPYYYDCPIAILNLLSESDCDSVNEWRNACKANVVRTKEFTSLKYGNVVTTDKPVPYGKFGEFSTFRCIDKKKNHWMASNANSSLMVKFNKRVALDYGFKVVK